MREGMQAFVVAKSPLGGLLRILFVGGARLITSVTSGTNVAGGSTRGTLTTFISAMSTRLGTNNSIRLVKFNAFGITRHTRHANVGPEAGRAVGVTTSGGPMFGTNTTLGTTVGWLALDHL